MQTAMPMLMPEIAMSEFTLCLRRLRSEIFSRFLSN